MEDHLDIIVQSFRPFELNCLEFGHSVNHAFSVEISPTKNVGDLKDAIKEKLKPTLNHVDADSLILFQVSIAIEDDNCEEKVKKLDLNLLKRLSTHTELSSCFANKMEDYLNIIIKCPPPYDQLQLNCLKLGDSIHHVISVKISPTKNVAQLKDVIKRRMKPHFDHVPANTLDLWKVSLPADDDFDERLKMLDLSDKRLLLPVKQLGPLFSDEMMEENIHIIVKPPPPNPEEVAEDTGALLVKRYKKTVAKALGALKFAKYSEYRAYQHSLPIHDGRYDIKLPTNTAAPPIQLFHPVFGHFLDDLKRDFLVPDKDLMETVLYMHEASGIYDSEDSRKLAIHPVLRKILGMEIRKVYNTDGTIPDGLMEISLTGDTPECVTTLLVEDKRDFGDEGLDPSTQAGLSMARYWAQPEHTMIRNNTCCPMFLFANAGPWFAILGATFSDKVVVQRLTDYIWVGMDSTLNEEHCRRVAHIMHALKMGIQRLRDYYIGLKLEMIQELPNELHPRYCPSAHTYLDENGRAVEFKYRKPLEDHPSCVTFLAHTVEDSSKLIVVKFVQRYGADAHRFLAKQKMAPELLYYGKIGVQDSDPSHSPLSMVVMEYIEGTTLDKAKKLKRVPPLLKDQVKTALQHLHGAGFVFGDLRAPNVMITRNGEVKLIDFDWAGVHEKSKYPLLVSPALSWPKAVQGLSVMEQWHDNDMSERLLDT